MGEGYQQLMDADKAVVAEGEAVVGVVRAEAEAVGALMARSSTE